MLLCNVSRLIFKIQINKRTDIWLNIEVNEPNKAFLFGINYVIVSDDQDYRDELDQMFDVKYQSEEQIELKLNCL